MVFPQGKLLYVLAIQLNAAIVLWNLQACLVYLCECHFKWAVAEGPKIFHLKSWVILIWGEFAACTLIKQEFPLSAVELWAGPGFFRLWILTLQLAAPRVVCCKEIKDEGTECSTQEPGPRNRLSKGLLEPCTDAVIIVISLKSNLRFFFILTVLSLFLPSVEQIQFGGSASVLLLARSQVSLDIWKWFPWTENQCLPGCYQMLDLPQEDIGKLLDLKAAAEQAVVTAFHTNQSLYLELEKEQFDKN